MSGVSSESTIKIESQHCPARWWLCLRDRSAAVALTFAISVLPVTLLIGVAIDLGFVTQSKSQLNAAADAAALAAATTAANGFTAGLPNYIALGQTAGPNGSTVKARRP